MLPPNLRYLFKQIEQAVDKANRREDERNERSAEQQAAVAISIQRLADELKTYDEKQNAREDGKRRRENKTIRSLAAAAVFTLALATVGIAQVYTFIVSERAFVVPVDTNFTNGLVVKENPLEMWISLKNKGKSIASIDVLEVAITHGLAPKPQYLAVQRIAYPPIASGETFERPLEFETGWPQPIIEQLTHGALNFFLYGRVQYRDDFSWFGPRINGFCFKYRPGPVGGPHVFEPCQQTAYTYSE
jgi:hypothetical protein